MTPRIILSAAALAAAIVPAAIVHAAPTPEQAPRVQVSYADLDLADRAGTAALKARVSRAATQVCAAPDSRSSVQSAEVRTCRNAALASAHGQLRSAIANARTAPHYAQAEPQTPNRGASN